MIPIRLGTNRYGNPVYFPETLSHNVVVVLAKQRYGKTVLVQNLYTQIAEHRNIIIFDYNGDHRLSRWGNWLNTDHNISFIADLHTIENFAFYLSDFDNYSDWLSMGFSEKAVHIIMEFLSYPEIHHDNPLIFIEMLEKAPHRDDMIEPFNEAYGEYGLTRKDRVHEGVKNNLVNTFRAIWRTGLLMPALDSPDYEIHTPGKQHVDDWAQLVLDTPHLHINLNIDPADNIGIVRASVGKILDKIHPILHIAKPCIVVEEADFLAPNMEGNDETITSLFQLRYYVNKEQRTGVEVIFITQQPGFMDYSILAGGMIWIMGPHTPSPATINTIDDENFSYANKILSNLQYDLNRGKDSFREFAIMQSGSGSDGKFQIFRPDDALNVLPWELYKRKKVNPRAAIKKRTYELMI